MNITSQKGIILWPLILGTAVLLGAVILVHSITETQKSKLESASTTPVTQNASTSSATPAVSGSQTKGIISGSLIYPSEQIPQDLGVCAQRIDSPELVVCTNQTKDSKFQYGVGYELSLDPGNYYVYSFLANAKAYYTEYVLCGLKAECKSHTKIPVVVTAGSHQDNVLPHDWYDIGPTETSTPSNTPTPNPTTVSTVKPTLKIVPVVSIKLEKEMINILPTATPTPIPTVIIKPIEKPKFELSW
ncbi:MAG: hypothetical protein WC841_05895 [Candidatus Shapirobacteria bacterium]|jgi:hypothetical protein